jgi:hypothetical protein
MPEFFGPTSAARKRMRHPKSAHTALKSSAAAKQFAEKLTIGIRISLQRYRKSRESIRLQPLLGLK